MKIRSLDETEGVGPSSWSWEPDDPLAFVGHQMVSMAAWVADQEREVGRRAHQRGGWRRQEPGPDPGTAALPHRRPGAASQADERRRSVGRKIAQLLEVNEKTVRNALKAEP